MTALHHQVERVLRWELGELEMELQNLLNYLPGDRQNLRDHLQKEESRPPPPSLCSQHRHTWPLRRGI